MKTTSISHLGRLVMGTVLPADHGWYKAELKGWLFEGDIYYHPETLGVHYGRFEQQYLDQSRAYRDQINQEARRFFQQHLR